MEAARVVVLIRHEESDHTARGLIALTTAKIELTSG